MALTFTTNLPPTLNVVEGDPINLTVEVTSDDPAVLGVEFAPFVSGAGSTPAEVTGTAPNFTYTFTIPAAALSDSGNYKIDATETDGAGNYIPAGPPFYVSSTTTAVTVDPAAVAPALINGRTPEEHRRMVLLGYI